MLLLLVVGTWRDTTMLWVVMWGLPIELELLGESMTRGLSARM